MSVAPLKAFRGMDWMKFSLRSLRRQQAGVSYTHEIFLEDGLVWFGLALKHTPFLEAILTTISCVNVGFPVFKACFSTSRNRSLFSAARSFTTLIGAEQKAEGGCFLPAKTLRCGTRWRAPLTMQWLFYSGCIIHCSLML